MCRCGQTTPRAPTRSGPDRNRAKERSATWTPAAWYQGRSRLSITGCQKRRTAVKGGRLGRTLMEGLPIFRTCDSACRGSAQQPREPPGADPLPAGEVEVAPVADL